MFKDFLRILVFWYLMINPGFSSDYKETICVWLTVISNDKLVIGACASVFRVIKRVH